MIFPNPRRQGQFNHVTRHPFRGGGPQRAVTRGPNSGILQNISNPRSLATLANKGVNGLSKTLTNVQQVMNVVQSAAPVVQEYGPMVKNLPAMYRMIKAFKNADDVEDQTDSVKNTESHELNTSLNEKPNDHIQEKIVDVNQGQSIPKLFI